MSTLFDSCRLGRLTLPNRIAMAPMTRARATPDGLPTDSMAIYYAQRATAGLLITEGIQPSAQSQSSVYTPGLYNDEQVAAWSKVTGAVHANGGRIFAQLMHAGRVSHPEVAGFEPMAPSAVRPDINIFTGPKGLLPAPTPRAMTTEEVRDQIDVFVDAARRAIVAGFDGVELHGATGYLLHEFLSSNTNLRTDAYGGSINGRIRFVVEVAEAVAHAIGADRVGLRVSPGSQIWDIHEENVPEVYDSLIRALAPLDLGYLHTVVSTDEEVLLNMRKLWPTAYIVNPTFAGSPHQATPADGDYWLQKGADIISYGRAFLANPDVVERFRLGLSLTEADTETTYRGGDRGYIDYTSHQH